jgi:hypothetical protein
LVFAAGLRTVGLLDEPDPKEQLGQPHGLATGTAAAIITLLSLAIERGRDLGAVPVGDYTKLQAVEPLKIRRKQLAERQERHGGIYVRPVPVVAGYRQLQAFRDRDAQAIT